MTEPVYKTYPLARVAYRHKERPERKENKLGDQLGLTQSLDLSLGEAGIVDFGFILGPIDETGKKYLAIFPNASDGAGPFAMSSWRSFELDSASFVERDWSWATLDQLKPQQWVLLEGSYDR